MRGCVVDVGQGKLPALYRIGQEHEHVQHIASSSHQAGVCGAVVIAKCEISHMPGSVISFLL